MTPQEIQTLKDRVLFLEKRIVQMSEAKNSRNLDRAVAADLVLDELAKEIRNDSK